MLSKGKQIKNQISIFIECLTQNELKYGKLDQDKDYSEKNKDREKKFNFIT